ncbi:MAG TPA: polysaccharide biosynthesis tyrosine autokinase [Ornithinibacter sp.]|nr:polysaccharide biosynthesis tyrosine autokinase [Ornithinibacter sp.]
MELIDYWRILRRHWLGVVAIVLATVAIAAAYTLAQPKVYSANANGFVSTGPADNPALSSVNDQLAKSRATSYVDIATSRATAQAVIEDLGLDASPAGLVGSISVTQPKDTVLLKITADASTPEAAQQLADAWVRALATQVQKIEDPSGTGAPGVPQVLPVESAAVPTAPASPNPRLNLMLGAVLGLGLALGYAMLRHTVDRRLRSKEEIEAQFQISVVGGVPVSQVLKKDARGGHGHLAVDAAVSAANGPASEAFRKLRTNLMYMNVDNPPRVVVVTSPLPGDGKSTVAANLAAAIDSSGENVVLIDGDLRRPTVATWFGLVEGVGLTDVLAGRIPVEDALQTPVEHPNLRVLGAGAIPPNPSELLGSQVMRQLLQKLSADALVLIDAPPLLPVTDAALLTANADGALVVVSAGKTLDTQLGSALDHLSDVEAKALGVVLNRVSPRDAGNGYYDQYSGYYTQPGRRRSKK